MPLFLGENEISKVVVSVDSADGGVNTNDATLNSGAQMLSGVTAYSKGTKYTGTIATVTGQTPDIAVSDSGLITASVSNPKGYQSSATTKTATQQLTTQGIKVITPNDSVQTAVSAGVYTTAPTTVSAVPTETKTITANGTYSPSAGKYFSSVEVAIAGDTPTYQSKTVSPSTSVQTVTADEGYDALSDVTIDAIQTETKSVTSNGTYNPTSGKYFSSVTVNVPSETFNTQTKTVTPTESTQTVSPDNGYDGLSQITVNPISSTYVGSAVPTKGATAITPSSSSQTAISSGTYATGDITVSAIPSETKEITSNGTYTPTNGKWFSSVTVNVAGESFNTQTKSVSPTESEQTITPDAGYDGLSSVTVGAISSTYIGSGITRKSAETYTPTESEQTINAGQYLDGAQTIAVIPSTYVGSGVTRKSAATIVPSESEQTIAANQYLTGVQTISAIPSTYVGSGVTRKGATAITPSTSSQVAVSAGTYVTGNITVSAMPTGVLSTPSINTSTGVVTAGVATSGYLSTSDTKTLQLTTKSTATITPSTTDQTIPAGRYLTGTQTIKGDPNLVSSNIISGASIFGVPGSVVTQDYYVGDTEPSNSLGNDGDLYFMRG